jgi:hypothetical protein
MPKAGEAASASASHLPATNARGKPRSGPGPRSTTAPHQRAEHGPGRDLRAAARSRPASAYPHARRNQRLELPRWLDSCAPARRRRGRRKALTRPVPGRCCVRRRRPRWAPARRTGDLTRHASAADRRRASRRQTLFGAPAGTRHAPPRRTARTPALARLVRAGTIVLGFRRCDAPVGRPRRRSGIPNPPRACAPKRRASRAARRSSLPPPCAPPRPSQRPARTPALARLVRIGATAAAARRKLLADGKQPRVRAQLRVDLR